MASFPSPHSLPTALADIWRAKLSRSIAISVFISIVLIEIGIFVPSLWREKQDQINQMAELSKTARAALNQSDGSDGEGSLMDEMMEGGPSISPAEVAEKLQRNLATNPHLVGIVIYGPDGQELGRQGEHPALTLSDLPESDLSDLEEKDSQPFQYRLSSGWSRLDIVWSQPSEGPYSLVMRHDFTESRASLGWFTLRIAGLVLIISFFVTGVTMVVVYRRAVGPILKLRRELEGVGERLASDGDELTPLYCEENRTDELGDVQRAFDTMYATIRREIENRRQAELKSEKLLRNILPVPIADRLKRGEQPIADRFEEATVLFADLAAFTSLAAELPPGELVEILNRVFSRFDQLADSHDLEKIKTIGDAYMVVGGLPMTHTNIGVTAIADMALDMLDALTELNDKLGLDLKLRIGIHHGPVVAGVIGLRKPVYDLWGDTVNVASRMESHGEEGRIHTTDVVYQMLKDHYAFEDRGTIDVKGRGPMQTYWMVKRTAQRPTQMPPLEDPWQRSEPALNPASTPASVPLESP
ncbi:MAG: adenylate/guanylate cyclase domain-containing protein [Cyanobacteria bacterium P01_H01_bin.130]